MERPTKELMISAAFSVGIGITRLAHLRFSAPACGLLHVFFFLDGSPLQGKKEYCWMALPGIALMRAHAAEGRRVGSSHRSRTAFSVDSNTHILYIRVSSTGLRRRLCWLKKRDACNGIGGLIFPIRASGRSCVFIFSFVLATNSIMHTNWLLEWLGACNLRPVHAVSSFSRNLVVGGWTSPAVRLADSVEWLGSGSGCRWLWGLAKIA